MQMDSCRKKQHILSQLHKADNKNELKSQTDFHKNLFGKYSDNNLAHYKWDSYYNRNIVAAASMANCWKNSYCRLEQARVSWWNFHFVL